MRLILFFFACLSSIGHLTSLDKTTYECIEEMSLEEKIGQILMVHFQGESVNETAEKLIRQFHIGSIIYYNWANGLTSPHQVQKLSYGLQAAAQLTRHKIPLLIAADQEGGIVARCTDGCTQFPGNYALGIVDDSQLSYESFSIMGKELRAVGINMNLSPVVDINLNPHNPVIGLRSFSSDPDTVIRHALSAIRAYRNANVISTLKHYPGHGDVSVDSHEELPVVNKPLEELKQFELKPYFQLAANTDAILTAHLLLPALDEHNCATLSSKVLRYLRDEIGFQGVIVSDSLIMDAVLKKCGSVDEAAIQALNAGCDILILGGRLLVGKHSSFELSFDDIQRIHGSLVHATKSGRIAMSRVDDAVLRILSLKKKYPLNAQTSEKIASSGLSTTESLSIATNVAQRAVRPIAMPKKGGKFHACAHLKKERIAIIAPKILEPGLDTILPHVMGASHRLYTYKDLNPSSLILEDIKKEIEQSDVVIAFSYNSWKNEGQKELIYSLIATEKPVAVIVVRDPVDADLFSEAESVIVTHSPTTMSIKASLEYLKMYLHQME